jgi:hypothetical protein
VKHRFCLCALILLVCGYITSPAPQTRITAPAPQTTPTPVQTLHGTWAGTLQAGDAVLHLVLHISRAGDGSLKAALDSLDQGVYGIDVSSIKHTESALNFEVVSVNAS